MLNFSNIRTMIDQGKYKEIDETLERFDTQIENKNSEDKMKILFWNAVCQICSGNYSKGEFYAKLYNQKSKLFNNEIFKLIALLLTNWSKFCTGMINEGLIGIEKAINLLNKMKKTSNEEISQLESKILLLAGSLYNEKGDFEKALDYFSQSLELSKSIKYTENSTSTITCIGTVYLKKGELDEALKYLKQSREISKSNKFLLNETKAKLNIGVVYLKKGELKKALRYFSECMEFFDSINHKPLIATILSYLGNIYALQGKLSTALEYQQKSLILREEIGNKLDIARSHVNLGNIYIEKGEFNLAKKNFDKTLYIADFNGFDYLKVWTLFDLIYLLRMNLPRATVVNYLEEISFISINQPNKLYNQIYRLSNALVLRNSGGNRLVDIVQSHQILQNLVTENEREILDQEIKIASISALTDSLFYEFKHTHNPVIIDELETLSGMILNIAEIQNSYILFAKGFLLKAKIELAKEDIFQSRIFMIKAQNIADEKNLTRLAQLISFEHDKLLEVADSNTFKEPKVFKSIVDTNPKISDSVIYFNGKANVKIPTKSEDPIFLSIIANNGISIFDCKFKAKSKMHGQLIAGFLSAINNFGQEVLSSIGTFDRLKHGEHTIVMRPKNKIMFAYAFKGQSYAAIKKLDKFMNNLSCLDNIWLSLLDSSVDGSKIPQQERFVINSLVTDIFLKPNEFY